MIKVYMRRLIAIVAVVLGVSLISCKKDIVEPEVPVVIAPVEPEPEEEPETEPEEEEFFLETAFRLKVYYTKLNLKDTTHIKIVGVGNEVLVDTKVVPEGDISILNFREGKYDLVDSTDYYYYQSAFEYNQRYRSWSTNNPDLFYNLYRGGYIHKVVVEMSNISGIDYRPNRLDVVTKSIFLEEFERSTYNIFKSRYLDPIYTRFRTQPTIYYIKDLITEPVETDMYIEFKDVPYYRPYQ